MNNIKSTIELINQAIIKLQQTFRIRLDSPTNYHPHFQQIIADLMKSSIGYYNCITHLTFDIRKWPIQAQVLSRSILDAVFTVIALCDNPEENYLRYIKGSYRSLADHQETNKERFLKNPAYNEIYSLNSNLLKATAEFFKFTKEEIASRKRIDFWPNASQMRKSKFLSDGSRDFISDLYCMEYHKLSEYSHQSQMMMSLQYVPLDIIRSQGFLLAASFITMIFSEVEGIFRFNTDKELVSLWEKLIILYHPSREYFEMRYSGLLSKDHYR